MVLNKFRSEVKFVDQVILNKRESELCYLIFDKQLILNNKLKNRLSNKI